jgi:hypothetical protein
MSLQGIQAANEQFAIHLRNALAESAETWLQTFAWNQPI